MKGSLQHTLADRSTEVSCQERMIVYTSSYYRILAGIFDYLNILCYFCLKDEYIYCTVLQYSYESFCKMYIARN